MARKTFLLICLLFIFESHAQLPGSGNAASFDNSFLAPLQMFPAVPTNISLPVTMAAWVNVNTVPGKTFYPIFSSHNTFTSNSGFFIRIRNAGFTFVLEAGFGNGSALRVRNAPIPPAILNGGYFHVAAVVVNNNDIRLYLNGNEITTGNFLGTAPSMVSVNALGSFIGGQFDFGARIPFSGQIDHLNIWNNAQTINQIRANMCSKINPASPGLLYYYDFDIRPTGILGFLSNTTTGAVVASGNATQILSGAPIGDTSVFIYPSSWTGQSLTFNSGGESIQAIFVNNPISGGFHFYKVNQPPNNINGISDPCLDTVYYGAYVGLPNAGNLTYSVRFRSPGSPVRAWTRAANNTPTWGAQLPVTVVSGGLDFVTNARQREWIFPRASLNYNPNLDTLYPICSFPFSLSVPNPTGATLNWSNGGSDTTQTFNGPGFYSLIVTDTNCNNSQTFTFVIGGSGPIAYSPGIPDTLFRCNYPFSVTVPPWSEGTFLWSDSTISNTFTVTNTGNFTLTLTDSCANDTTFSFWALPPPPTPITFNPGIPDTLFRCSFPFSVTIPPWPDGTFLWSDSTSSNTFTVNNSGNFTLTLTDSCANDSTFSFWALPPPPTPITFNPGIPDTLFRCSFPFSVTLPPWPDGTFLWSDSTSLNSFQVPAFGSYSLTLTDSCGNDSVIPFVVAPSPFPGYNPGISDTILRCVFPFSVSAAPFSGGSLLWPDSTTSTNYQITTAGNFSLQAIDSCNNIQTFIFTVLASGSSPIPIIIPDTLFTCHGDSVVLTYTPPTGVTAVNWSNGQTGNTFASHTPGTYTIEITDTCGAVYSRNFVIALRNFATLPPPVPANVLFCRDSLRIAVTLPADFGIEWFNSSTDTVIFINQGGIYTYDIIDPCGVINTYTFQVDTLNYLTAQPSIPDTLFFCDFPAWVSSNPITDGFILWPDNSTLDSFLVTSPGSYILIWGDTCSSFFSRTFFVGDADSISLNIDLRSQVTNDCDYPIAFTLPNVAGVNYVWSTGTTGNTLTVNQPGNYGVEAFGPCGLIASDQISLIALNEPVLLVTEVPWCPGENAFLFTRLMATDGNYQWNTGATGQQVVADTAGIYEVSIFEDCADQRERFVVFERNDCEKLYIPNAFTPNNDGKNDFFEVFGDDFNEFYIVIFNRWGQKVFESESMRLGWDGTTNGQPQPGAVYNGLVRYRNSKGLFREKLFSLTLIR
jgi:gliding motility-associated-like protein